MKLSAFFSFYTLLIFLTIGCKEEPPTQPTKSDPSADPAIEEIKRLMRTGEEINASDKMDIPGLRAQALAILNHRLKTHKETYAIIESGVWEYEFVFDGKMSEPGRYNGVWIDFKNDHTYEYGTRGNIEGGGRYNYHFDRGELVLVDNNKGRRPQEFTVKIQNDVMVLVGTITYGDRNTQMKLDKVTEAIRQG